MSEQNSIRQFKTWVLVVKVCAALTAILSTLILGWSIWTLFNVPADDLSLERPFAWIFLCISAIMLLLCWRLFLQRIWAAVCVCLTGWICIFEMLSTPGGIINDPTWPYEAVFIVIIFALSTAMFTAKGIWKRTI